MDGVVLLAVFIFTALASLAVASRRPLLASLVLVAGAGWPSTIFPGHDDLGRGVLLLLAALALVARLGPTTRRGAPQVLVGDGARGHCARSPRAGTAWRKRSSSTGRTGTSRRRPGPRSASSTSGRRTTAASTSRRSGRACSPSRPTTSAPSTGGRRRSTRSTDNAWREELLPTEAFRSSGRYRDLLTDDPLLPKRARDATKWIQATVHIDALRDRHLISPSGPVAYAGDSLDGISYYRGGVAEVSRAADARNRVQRVGVPATAHARRCSRSRRLGTRARSTPTGHTSRSGPESSVPPFGTQKRLDLAPARVRRPAPAAVPASLPGGRGHRASGARRTRTRRPWRSRPGCARAEASATTSIRRRCRGMPPLVAFVTRTKSGLLPALRRRDGADAPLPRDSRARRGRLHERRLRRGPGHVARQRPERAHLGRGLVRRLRLAPVRPDPGARQPRRHLHDLVDLRQRLRGRERAQEEHRRSRGRRACSASSSAAAASGSEAPPGPRAATSPRRAAEARPRGASRSRRSSSPDWSRSSFCSWPRSSCSGAAGS